MSRSPQSHRCGVVALLGRPNAGKSTLLNALLGERLAAVSKLAQTTRGNLLAVLTRPGAQLLFRDTPGVHGGLRAFNQAMSEQAVRAAEDADVRLLLLDARASWQETEERLAQLGPPTLLVRTKCDLSAATAVADAERFAAVLEISAVRGTGLDRLIESVVSLLPEGPPLYPEDFLTDAPMRFLAAEQIREVAFERLHDELPYALAVEVIEWKESEREVRVRANLLVERESQKGIVIGAGGRSLRELGIEARRRLSELAGKPVHINLWVKTDRNWSKRPRRIRQLGYL